MSEQSPKRGSRAVDMTEGVIWKQLLLFFLPILLGTFFQQLYNTVDAIIVGRGVSKQALAAVGGSPSQLLDLLVGFFTGLASGATIIISHAFGARRDEDASRAVHTAMVLALLFGLVLSAVGWILTPRLLVFMDTPDDVMLDATAYLRICFIGMTASLIYNVGSGILRAIGDSRRPLYFLIVATVFNIIMDCVLVLALRLGVAGAALATILSQLLSAVMVCVVLGRSRDACRLIPRALRIHAESLRRIIRIGLPAGLQSVLYSISNIIIQTAINGLGTDAAAGWTAASKMDNIYWIIISALGIAITTFVGQNYGAGKLDRLRAGVRQALILSFGMTAVICCLLLCIGRPLLTIFSSDEGVLTQGWQVMNFLIPTYATYVCIEILSGAMRGAGDPITPTIMTLVGCCLLRVLWVVLYVPAHHTLRAVMASYPVSWISTSVAFVISYRRGAWLKRAGRLTR